MRLCNCSSHNQSSSMIFLSIQKVTIVKATINITDKNTSENTPTSIVKTPSNI